MVKLKFQHHYSGLKYFWNILVAWLNVKFYIWRIFHVYHLKLSVFLFMYTLMTPMWVPPLSSVSPGPLVYFEVKGHQSFSLTLTCHYVQRILQGMTSATKPALSVCVHILHTSLEGWSFWQLSFPMKITVEQGFINPNIMRMLEGKGCKNEQFTLKHNWVCRSK